VSDIQSIFMKPNFVVRNKATGDPIFEMKRKTPTRPDGTEECYYLFKFYDENMPDEATKLESHKLFEQGICPMATILGVGMFSFDELTERCVEKVKEILQGGGQLSKEQVDVSIELFNHATKELDNLIVGVSTKPVEEIEELRKRGE